MPPPGFPPSPRGPPATLQPAKLTDFQITAALGAGTTAKVYDAVHIATGRAVAIKVLEPSHAGSQMRERFAREAVLLAGVVSHHVGRIEAFGFERGQPFLVLERLEGETLDAKLRRDGAVPAASAVPWIEQLLLGVRDAHDQQIIHRDIKPSNIFLHKAGSEEIVKLIDFGVARLREVTGDEGGITGSNHLIGSMGYMAPEQFRDPTAVNFTADLYAIGVCIFRTLTGRLPFVSRSLDAVIRMKAEQAAPTLSSMPGMPENGLLDWFVAKALAREPAARFENAREMLAHWWDVMESLDEESATDVMRGLGRRLDASSSSTGTTRQGMRGAAHGEVTLRDEAPYDELATEPGSTGESATAFDGDPSSVPTKNNPGLKKLVEQELELHRNRKAPRR